MEIQKQNPQKQDVVEWKIVGTSAVGTSHKSVDRGCEDYYNFQTLEDGSTIIAVADGVGSAVHAAKGAAWVVEAALNKMREELTEYGEPENEHLFKEKLKDVLSNVRIALEDNVSNEATIDTVSQQNRTQFITSSMLVQKEFKDDSKVNQQSLREYATTLLIVTITRHWLAVVQIGDGVVVLQQDTRLEGLTKPSHGEYINESNFITDSDYLRYAQYNVVSIENVQGIALLTDGLQVLALNLANNTPYAPFFLPLFKLATNTDFTEDILKEFLESDRVCERTDDDKTLILAIRI